MTRKEGRERYKALRLLRQGVHTRKVYIDGYGKEQDISCMEASHIINTIGYITSKMIPLAKAELMLGEIDIHSYGLAQRLMEMRDSVKALGQELMERETNDAD